MVGRHAFHTFDIVYKIYNPYLLVMVQQGTACRYPALLVIFYHNSSAEKSPKKKYSSIMILNKIYMPIEKHTINIIFFPILHFFFLNKNSESKIAISIIVIAHTIIYLYFEFVNYAVITNG